jgi:hypothetical protein
MSKPILTLKLTPYPWTLTLWTDRQAMDRHLKKMRPDRETDPTDVGGRCVSMLDMRHTALGIYQRDLGVLVHELQHALCHIFDEIGIQTNAGNSEPAAYMLQFMFNECRRAMFGRRK